MTQNIFLDKSATPTAASFAKALKGRGKYWDELKHHVRGPVVEEWKYYGKTIGWTKKLLLGKRNLFFLTVRNGYFVVSFVLGDKAVALAQGSRLSKELIRQLVHAKKYVEGRGIRIEVKSRRALEQAKILLDIKLAR